MQLHFY